MLKSRGILRCFNTWVLLECDDQIGAMYRSLYSLEYFYKEKIQKPLWGTHISIIRGESILNERVKNDINGMSIEFYYSSRMHTNSCHFWLPVLCPLLDTIREEFVLGKSVVRYHLSIGNIRHNNKYYTETFI